MFNWIALINAVIALIKTIVKIFDTKESAVGFVKKLNKAIDNGNTSKIEKMLNSVLSD